MVLPVEANLSVTPDGQNNLKLLGQMNFPEANISPTQIREGLYSYAFSPQAVNGYLRRTGDGLVTTVMIDTSLKNAPDMQGDILLPTGARVDFGFPLNMRGDTLPVFALKVSWPSENQNKAHIQRFQLKVDIQQGTFSLQRTESDRPLYDVTDDQAVSLF